MRHTRGADSPNAVSGADAVSGAGSIDGSPIVTPTSERVINLAGWGDRILAYIIDIILAGIVLAIIKGIIFIPSWVISGMADIPNYVPWSSFGIDNLFWFAYFLFMDLTYGQSIGKMVMKIRVTNMDGGPIDITQAAIEAFGKAFLLPLDVILGWIFTNQKSQRIFTYLAKTIVVKKRD